MNESLGLVLYGNSEKVRMTKYFAKWLMVVKTFGNLIPGTFQVFQAQNMVNSRYISVHENGRRRGKLCFLLNKV